MILSSASSPHWPWLGWLLALAAALAYVLPAPWLRAATGQTARLGMVCAWILHALALVWGLLPDSQGLPHFGFAPALSMTAWLVLTTYAMERQWFPQMHARWALSILAAATLLAAAVFPGLPLPDTSSAWLPLHLTLGIACYGLFAAAVVHAWLMGRAERHIRLAEDPHSGIPLLTLERLTFRFVGAGFVLLSATLAAGWAFGEQLYGRAWRWDHKTVFSLLSWATFAVLLLGRSQLGWRGRGAVRVLYTGALLLLLAYAGSRFVLEVILERSAWQGS